MPVFVAFLRAVNLGRHRRVGMTDVRAVLTDAGYGDITTYLQSGNVIFAATPQGPEPLAGHLEALLSTRFGFELDIAVRTAGQLAKITRTNPLVRPRTDPTTLHVAFLRSRPSAAAVRSLVGKDFGRDEFLLNDSEIYLRYPDGLARSKMNTAFFERALGTPATVRTWKVVTRLDELARTTRSGS